jgi:acyl carrier protein
VEKVVAAIWEDMLQVPSIGVHDSILDLGGDSLRTAQVISRLRSVFGEHVPVSALYTALTVDEVSKVLVAHELKHGMAETIANLLLRIESMTPNTTPSSPNVSRKITFG